MFLGLILSGDEFLGNVFWTYLFGQDVSPTYLFGDAGVATTANVSLAPSGTCSGP